LPLEEKNLNKTEGNVKDKSCLFHVVYLKKPGC